MYKRQLHKGSRAAPLVVVTTITSFIVLSLHVSPIRSQIDEIHLLGVDRGPVLEVIVSRMRHIASKLDKPIRFIGLSTALANARDLADWLGIERVGLYNFRPSVRPVPMTISVQGFPGKHYCPRMATMNKPVYASIRELSPSKPVLVFVSSRRQTRLTALDLISYCASDDNPKQFLHMDEDTVTYIASTLSDEALRNTIVFGIGIHHAGLSTHDRQTVEQLFVSGNIQVLVCTSTLAWGVNFPAHLVIVKGTEYFDGKVKRYVDFPVTDVLQMIGRAGRPQFDDEGMACVFVHEPKKNFYRKFLFEPFPVESSLHEQLHNHINAEIAIGRIRSKRDCLDYLSWTYLFRRIIQNPSFYQVPSSDSADIQTKLMSMISLVLMDLLRTRCITISDTDGNERNNTNNIGNFSGDEVGPGLRVGYDDMAAANEAGGVDETIAPTFLGKVCSYYYLDYTTVFLFYTKLQKLHLDEQLLGEQKLESATLNRSHASLFRLLCDATEFCELPVRHNEELLNAELALQVPWPCTASDMMESPNLKAYLLLQAYLYHIKLPISDYINDTKSVLDQIPRVLNAMIDIAAELGLIDITIRLTKAFQMIREVRKTVGGRGGVHLQNR